MSHRKHVTALVLTSSLIASGSAGLANASTSLAELLWNNRLIVAFSNGESDMNTQLRDWVQSHECDLLERDVQVYLVTNQQATAVGDAPGALDAESIDTLEARRQTPEASFEVMLIGKDGGVKSSATSLSALPEFLLQIDGMPMRRAEAAQQTSSCH